MAVAVWKSEKEKPDPMAKALQMLQIGAAASSLGSGSKATPGEDLQASTDMPESQATAPQPVSGTNNKGTAMSRKYRSYTA